MPLYRLVAPLAAVLLIGAPQTASAATLTLDIPNCVAVGMTQDANGYTIRCTQSTMTCVGQASSSAPSGGTQIGLSVACTPAATSMNWATSRGCDPVTPGAIGSATVFQSAGGRSCVYTAMASSGSATAETPISVVWQGSTTTAPPNAPSGCTIARTPSTGTLGTGGGAISMTASCSGGNAVTSWSWRKNGQSFGSGAAGQSDTLPANTGSASVTHTYDVTACAGSTCATAVSTTFTVAGSGPVGFCSQFGDVRFVDLHYGSPPVDSVALVGLDSGTVLVGRITIPAGATSPQDQPGVISIVEYAGPTADRVASLSTSPCDFRGFGPGLVMLPASDPTGASAPLAWGAGINPGMQYLLTGDNPGFPPRPLLTPGATYYVNLQTVNFSTGQNSCSTGSCNVRITVNTPN
ncbi:MAG TPA: hypothetical protein VNE58_09445 [Casimicrobiaceae bacterium]|nr:hypothetical protein [Casimicrobiaceae bacterium]